MASSSAIRLLWRGHESVNEALDCLGESGRVEIQLAPDYHYALYRTIAEHPARADQLDVDGPPELLDRMAEVRGLEPLAELVEPLKVRHATVHVMSPGPIITLTLPGVPTKTRRGARERTLP